MSDRVRTVAGTVEFIWDGDGHMLLNLDPDDEAHPHTFEIVGEVRDRIAGSITEGDRIEIDFIAVEYEVVDPDSGPTDSHRAQVRDVRAT
ncbi:MAG: hypothetical protein WDZ37_06090 [Solirubrobacterales bacterium]